MEKDPVLYYSKSMSFYNFLKWTDQKERIAEKVLEVVKEKKDSLLDIGCGDGTLTKLIESRFNHITAVEPGPSLFRTLQTKCDSDKYILINLPFEKMSFNEQFDIIVASHALKFIPNPQSQLLRIKDMLKDLGQFLVIEHQPNNDYAQFREKYRKDVLGENAKKSSSLAHKELLESVFKVEQSNFPSVLTIPSVEEAISMLDFFYDIDINKIRREVVEEIRKDLKVAYGDGPVSINLQQSMYICSK